MMMMTIVTKYACRLRERKLKRFVDMTARTPARYRFYIHHDTGHDTMILYIYIRVCNYNTAVAIREFIRSNRGTRL